MTSLVKKFKEMWNPSDEYYDEEEEQEENYEENIRKSPFSEKRENKGRVVNLHSNSKLKVVLARPSCFGEEIKNVADELLKMHAVVLNLEGTPKPEARRLVDFFSGIAYAIGGKIKKVSTDTFVVTPCNVDFEGDDVLSELESRGVYF